MSENWLLYYITDRTAFPGDDPTRLRRLLEKIAEAARAGVDFIQLREKDLPALELESLAGKAVRVVREAGRLGTGQPATRLLINSRTDVALSVQADGVHLRGDDVSPPEVRQMWKKYGRGVLTHENPTREPLVAVSCHTQAEVVQAAANGATFSVFAPV